MQYVIIYSDLNGCFNEFKELRAKANPTKDYKEIRVRDILDKSLCNLCHFSYWRW